MHTRTFTATKALIATAHIYLSPTLRRYHLHSASPHSDDPVLRCEFPLPNPSPVVDCDRMDPAPGSESNAFQGWIDQTQVMNVMPLRHLVPIFENVPVAPLGSRPPRVPVTCPRPTGSQPTGIQRFNPFLVANNGLQRPLVAQNPPANFGFGRNTVPNPVLLNSFMAPQSQVNVGTSQNGGNIFRNPVLSNSFMASKSQANVGTSQNGGNIFLNPVLSNSFMATNSQANVGTSQNGGNIILNPVLSNSFMAAKSQANASTSQNGGNIFLNPVLSNSFMATKSQVNVGTVANEGTSQQPIILEGDESSGLQSKSEGQESALSDHHNQAATSSRRKRSRPGNNIPENVTGVNADMVIRDCLSSFLLDDIAEFKGTCGDRVFCRTILLAYELIRRKISRLDEESNSVSIRRPDLKVGAVLMDLGFRANGGRRLGAVPGIEVGDIFFFRTEMCIVGLHIPNMGGIDYIYFKTNETDNGPIAVSIVQSGGHEAEGANANELIYLGQGGGAQKEDKKTLDQKLEKGNLALDRSLLCGNVVRVIRSVPDATGSTRKIYIYDGLYTVQKSWNERNNHECNVFKFNLVRLPGQPDAFSIWKAIQQWKNGMSPRPGLLCADLSGGTENFPVTLVNEVDAELGPDVFLYTPSLIFTRMVFFTKPFLGCNCLEGCKPGNIECPCHRRNNDSLPYSPIGVVWSNRMVIHECGSSCGCPADCRNRITQAGIKVRLEVFRTTNRGWALRSWDPIRAGSFICEYAGEVLEGPNADTTNNHYIFDATRSYKPPEAIRADESTRIVKSPFAFIINAKTKGNVARFMNHSCSPNVYWKPVLQESKSESYFRVAFFALHHIPPLQELTYDYGSDTLRGGNMMQRLCLCGSENCTGTFNDGDIRFRRM